MAIMYEIRPTKEIKPFSEFAFPMKDEYFILTHSKEIEKDSLQHWVCYYAG